MSELFPSATDPMKKLVIINGMVWDGIHEPFLGTVVCTDRITEVLPGPPSTIPSGADVLDAKGGSVTAALTDVHQHFSAWARAQSPSSLYISLYEIKSLEEVIEMLLVRSKITAPEDWVIGVAMDHNIWKNRRVPTRLDLDVIPNPTLITHQCGHSYYINSRAIELIGESKFDSSVGVCRDGDGRMTGVLEEEGHAPLCRYFQTRLKNEPQDWIDAMQYALSMGIAEVDPICSNIVLAHESIRVYEKLRDADKLSIRIRYYLTDLSDAHDSSPHDEWLSYGGRKIFIDGAFGGRTAAMREPFRDTGQTGMLCHTNEDLYEIIKETFNCGLQLMAHVIGDRGLDQILNVLERLVSEGI
jgi:predicted amidohydrolase YtcJ